MAHDCLDMAPIHPAVEGDFTCLTSIIPPCCRLRWRKPDRVLRRVVYPLALRFLTVKESYSVGAATGVCRRTIHLHTRRRTPFARQDGNAATARRSWSRRWRRVGIAAAWCASFVLVQWSWENRST